MAQSLAGADTAFDQFAAITLSIAGGRALVRSDAVAWSQARETLLGSDYRDVMPGFVFQCLSIFKFRDFILLYHPDSAQRRAFLEELLEPADHLRRSGHARRGAGAAAARATGDATPNDTGMREWML